MKNNIQLAFYLSCLAALLCGSQVFAATISILPSSGAFAAGQTLNATIYLSSADQEINAASGRINYTKEKLEVVSISKQGSIFNLWIKEPAASNAAGTLDFEGVVLNPGFKGQAGKIMTVIFKAKTSGIAVADFSGVSILANDGQGSNVLKGASGAEYKISAAILVPMVAAPAPAVPAVIATDKGAAIKSGKMAAPQINSVTHPDQERWYPDRNPELIWNNSGAVSAVRLLVDKKQQESATIEYAPAIAKKQIKELEAGTWYFHLQQKANGVWGKTAYYKVNIDFDPPQLSKIDVVGGQVRVDPRPELYFTAQDSLSGIDYYQIMIDNGLPRQTYENRVQTEVLAPGRHNIAVRAFDKAGNFSQLVTEIQIVPLEGPKLLSYRDRIAEGSLLSLRGASPANVLVDIFIEDQQGNINKEQVKSDHNGKWDYVSFPLEAGAYRVWAKNVDASGVTSNDSNKLMVTVEKPALLRLGRVAIDYLSVTVALMLLVGALVCGLVLTIGLIMGKKRKVNKEIEEAQRASATAFELLKKEVEEQVAAIDRYPSLSKREEKVAGSLKEALDISEKFIAKEISDIKKEIDK